MDETKAALGFAALGLGNRLKIVRMLIDVGPDGIAAGDVADRMGARQTSVSSQLRMLAQADVLIAERRGRQIFYKANLETLRELVGLLAV